MVVITHLKSFDFLTIMEEYTTIIFETQNSLVNRSEA